MSKPITLKRTEQCEKCPWKVTTDPHEIPRGYDPEKHANLKRTIAGEDGMGSIMDYLNKKPLRQMACHEEHDTPCLGWLMHQLGRGNNIHLRIAYHDCTNLGDVKLVGEQHESFEDTLPEDVK